MAITIKELQDQIADNREWNKVLESAHDIGMKPNAAFREWLDEVERDLAEGIAGNVSSQNGY